MRIYDRIKNMTLEEMAIHYAKLNEALYIGIKNKLKAMIRECVKGQIKAAINELMQGKDFRDFLRDKIMEEIGMKVGE